MQSWMSRPMGLSASAVTTAVSRPKQRLRPRATLYSPPPSQTRKVRVVATRSSPGSRRSITSPSETRSKRLVALGLIERGNLALLLVDGAGQEAAVHAKHFAVDEAGGFRREEDGSADQLFQPAEAAHRGAHQELLAALGAV